MVRRCCDPVACCGSAFRRSGIYNYDDLDQHYDTIYNYCCHKCSGIVSPPRVGGLGGGPVGSCACGTIDDTDMSRRFIASRTQNVRQWYGKL